VRALTYLGRHPVVNDFRARSSRSIHLDIYVAYSF
jgi:hypothetical protein